MDLPGSDNTLPTRPEGCTPRLGGALLGQLQDLESERERLAATMSQSAPTPARLPPDLPELYRQKVAKLRDALADPLIPDEALDLLRGLITRVVVQPSEGHVDLVVEEGALAAMLALGQNASTRPGGRVHDDLLVQVKLVAGAGFEPATFRL